jgi:hypothetical protein
MKLLKKIKKFKVIFLLVRLPSKGDYYVNYNNGRTEKAKYRWSC